MTVGWQTQCRWKSVSWIKDTTLKWLYIRPWIFFFTCTRIVRLIHTLVIRSLKHSCARNTHEIYEIRAPPCLWGFHGAFNVPNMQHLILLNLHMQISVSNNILDLQTQSLLVVAYIYKYCCVGI